ncbi:tripartite tricarboxylate transporter substrate binding protein [Nonomuraea sp. NPDC005650]|uniref:Bug family tripartite tricarboxylate transporter substrate binding protein n=1 Tax=Nonomuraea sp. NPDC005650 TaxID=3157045 RepID=UPI0033A3C05D
MKVKITATATVVAVMTALAACGAQQSGGAAGAWPRKGKPVTLIVSFAPGAAVDAAARVVAPVLEKELGTNVEVLNRPGAGGQIGYTALTKAKPDGYTIGATGSPSVVVSPLDPSRGATYTRQSFQPLGMQVLDPMLVGVAPGSPYKDLKALIEAVKAKPKSVTATTTGVQTGEHFALADIQQKTGAEFAPVHFSEGAASAIAAFLGEHVTVFAGNVSDVKDLVAQGKIRVLGIMSAERSPFLPDAPTFAEQGYQVEAATARGYSAPAGLPDEVRVKIEGALKKAIEDPAVVAKMKDLGLNTAYKSGQDYSTYWAEQETTVKQALPLVRNTKS